MKDFRNLSDGQTIEALICFTDVTGFSGISRTGGTDAVVQMLRDLTGLIDAHLKPTAGWIVKYIGDASLIVFPDECVDEGVRALLELKTACDGYFIERELPNRITFAMHFGEVSVVRLPPVQALDVLGEAVNTAAMLEQGRSRGRFVISPQVFRKLEPQTRRSFHKFTPPVVYYAE